MRAGLYARVSTHDQQTLSLQVSAMQSYAHQRGWDPVLCIEEVGSGSQERMQRGVILQAAKKREIDVIVVWRLDRWGRSVVDLLSTLQEFSELGVGFVSITEAFDLTTSAGRAMAGLFAVFAEFEREMLRERVKAGIAHAREQGKRMGRPPTARQKTEQVRQLFAQGMSKSQIAKQVGIGRTSVRRILTTQKT
jgi:putative DNA-invertase from lambdoid prophage Rac